jgi:uncharacterized protein YcfL
MYVTQLISFFLLNCSHSKEFSASKHQGLVFHPSYVHEKVGLSKKGVNEKYLHKKD